MTRFSQRWGLFWVLALLVSAADCAGLPATDFHSIRGMEPIILHTVRCALPLFVLAFVASSATSLWPNRITRWLLSNRRYIGLAFAFGMAWHFAFVAYAIASFGNPLTARATALDLTGLTFVALLAATSSQATARRLGAARWRRLHKTGVYVIWFVASYIYLGNLRRGADVFHVLAFAILVGAALLRVAAWLKDRNRYARAATAAGRGGNPSSSR